ncbi:uncharacterized protein FSUBG_1915 [Fusarium subglutinans]|uniref:F-box domain-containing protein n=1 Tax=Gibberella subglutinans TaxID=42677 RepID=A0A8H5QD84_GIBSU|nr:uncharacterized protein FSUBG_1915 [Fusarium subglutinans]KAF5611888.1 hypothetical protein FSUBG_1915 [Fusarium subglutinans]
MDSQTFSSLPGDLHLEIGKFLKSSEMEGLIASSKSMRRIYAPSYFHTVAFRGTSMDLVMDLFAFKNANRSRATTSHIVVPAIKHVTISQEADTPSPAPHLALVLPRLIASSLGVMRNLQSIQLDLWWFSDAQQKELRDRCAGLPVWIGLRSIQMEDEADTELLAVLVSKTRPESFSGLQFGGQLELQAARQCTPFLRRLVVPFRLPATADVGGRAGIVSNKTSLLMQFGRLEWLVLAPIQVKPGVVAAIREDPKIFLNVLLKEISRLPYLTRLGLKFPRSILVARQPGVPGTGTGLSAVGHYVRQWSKQIFAKIPALQQVAFIHGAVVLRAVRGADATIRVSIERDLDRHAFPFGTLY